MRKIKFLVSIVFVVYFLCGCGSREQLPDNPIVYEQGTNGEYVYFKYGEKIFVPYCPYESGYLGDCIGYCDIPADDYSDASKVYIFELKGYSSDEWIIETLALENCNEGMIFREVNTTNIPDGLASEYEWNS